MISLPVELLGKACFGIAGVELHPIRFTPFHAFGLAGELLDHVIAGGDRLIFDWLVGALTGRQTLDDGIVIWLEKKAHGDSAAIRRALTWWIDNTVACRFPTIVGTGLHGQVMRGVAANASSLLLEAKEYPATSSSLPSSPCTLGGCAPTISNQDIDPSRSPMTKAEAVEIYDAELLHQAEQKGWALPIERGLRSDADYAVIYGLHARCAYDPDDLAALLLYESEKAVERGMDYVIRTVQAAM